MQHSIYYPGLALSASVVQREGGSRAVPPVDTAYQHMIASSLTSHPQIQWLAAGTCHLIYAVCTTRCSRTQFAFTTTLFRGTRSSSTRRRKRTFFCDQTRHPVRPPCHPLQTSSRLKTGLPSAATVEKSPAYSSLGWHSPYFRIETLQLSCNPLSCDLPSTVVVAVC